MSGGVFVKLTEAQRSALECSGVLEQPCGAPEMRLFESFNPSFLHIEVGDLDAVLGAVIELANSEDAAAAYWRDRDEPGSARAARGACQALSNLADRVVDAMRSAGVA